MKPHALAFCLLLTGCMNLPPAIKNEPAVDIDYTALVKNVNSYKGAPARWGGKIIDVQNEQNFSLVQVLYYPLNYYGRPKVSDNYEGRFAIKSTDFLDPAIYTKDSEITVAGTFSGDIEQTIGKKNLRIPLISSSVIHLWPEIQPVNNYGYGGFGYGFGYPSYYGYPYYWGGFYRPYRW